MSNNEHTHEYKDTTYEVQEAVIRHWSYADHLITVLKHQKVLLFCITCGETKEIETK